MTHFLTIRVMKRICLFSVPMSQRRMRPVSRMRADDIKYRLVSWQTRSCLTCKAGSLGPECPCVKRR